jgi:transforming growth factor-beta-induced protein
MNFGLPDDGYKMSTRKSIFDVVETDGKFSILLQLLKKSGLGKAIRHEEKPLTFFAPTDGAFYLLFQRRPSLLPPDVGRLVIAPILARHLIPGVSLYTDDLRGRRSVVTMDGSALRLRHDDHRIFVNEAQILTAGVAASNGVVFAIDKVLAAPGEPPC